MAEAVTETMARQLMSRQDLAEELHALAVAVSGDERVRIEVASPGSGWRVQPVERVIYADLAAAWLREDDLRALVAHEAGHLVVSYYLSFAAGHPRHKALTLLLNCLEDCRMEEYVAKTWPGTRSWLAGVNQRLFPAGDWPESRFMELLMLIIQRHSIGLGQGDNAPHAEVAKVYCEVAEAVEDYIGATQPLSPGQVSSQTLASYRNSPVASYFGDDPDALSAMYRERSWAAYEYGLAVFAAAERLLDDDEAHGRQLPRDRGSTLRRVPDGTPGSAPAVGCPMSLPERLTEQTFGATSPMARPRGVEALVSELVRRLEAILPPVGDPHWCGPWVSGPRVALPRLMQAEADPAQPIDIWQRRGQLTSRERRFYGLVDLSGSMARDGRIVNAMKATWVFCEALEKLGFPFALAGFQDEVIPFLGLSRAMSPADRRLLTEMPLEVRDCRPGGHNRSIDNHDGPVLRDMVQRIADDGPLEQAVLVILSDGGPSGPGNGRRAAAALREAVAWVRTLPLTLVSLGIGPGTAHVTSFYGPTSRANVPLERLPRELASILYDQIRGARKSG